MNRSLAYLDTDETESYTVRAIWIGMAVGTFIGLVISLM